MPPRVHNTLVYGTLFVDYGQEQYCKQQEQREKKPLIKLAKKHEMVLQPCG